MHKTSARSINYIWDISQCLCSTKSINILHTCSTNQVYNAISYLINVVSAGSCFYFLPSGGQKFPDAALRFTYTVDNK